MKISSVIKKTAMWLTFIVQPFGSPLPDNGNDKVVPIWVAIIMGLFCLGALILVGLAIYAVLA